MTRSTHSTQKPPQERSSPRSQPPKAVASKDTKQTEHTNASSSSLQSNISSSTLDSVEDLDNGGTEPKCYHRRIAITPRDIAYIGYGICLGSFGSVCWKFLKENGIKKLLSIGLKPADELPSSYFKKCENIEIDENVRSKDDIARFVEEAVKYIEEGTRGDDILHVYSQGGESRPAFAIMAYLHKKKGFKWEQALFWVASKQPYIYLRPVFVWYMLRQAAEEGENFSIPGLEKGKPFRWDREEISKFLMKANHDMLFAGCEKDTRKSLKISFRTEEGKKW